MNGGSNADTRPDGLVVVANWFTRQPVDGQITMLTEPHVHELLRCNIWHVRGRAGDLLVDTGLGVAALAAAAADLFAADLLAVATHAHMDHLGGFHEFPERAIHRAEADAAASAQEGWPLDVGAYDGPTLEWLTGSGYDISGGLLTAVPAADFDIPAHELVAAAPTRVLDDGDVIDLGDRAFEVLHVPGHSPGSIALWDAKASMLFSGDAVYDGGLIDDLPGADRDAYQTTMHRLRSLPVDVVHGGHGPSMDRRRFHEVIDDYLENGTR